jgi:hypothetical protein
MLEANDQSVDTMTSDVHRVDSDHAADEWLDRQRSHRQRRVAHVHGSRRIDLDLFEPAVAVEVGGHDGDRLGHLTLHDLVHVDTCRHLDRQPAHGGLPLERRHPEVLRQLAPIDHVRSRHPPGFGSLETDRLQARAARRTPVA